MTVALSSSDLTEGTVAPASVTFTSANWNVAQTVTVTGVDDTILDGDQPYTIVTAPAVSADAAYNGLDAADVGVINIDNEKANIFVQPSKPLTTTESGGSATFTMRLTVAPSANVTCTLHSNDLTEGTVSPTTVVFTPANGTARITITVTGVDDTIVDGDQRYRIITDACSNTDATYDKVNPKDVKAVNLDND